MAASAISEYIKIRRFILNLIYLSEGKSVQIPTVQELCEKFNVSRPTVCKAMKVLTEDGYIIGKRGIGSFTNPSLNLGMFNPIEKKNPIIGIVIGDGMAVHYTPYTASIFSCLLKHFAMIPAIVHSIFLSSSEPKQIYKELLNERLDAIFWYIPAKNKLEVCRKLQKAKIPIVIGSHEYDGFNSVFFDYEEAGYKCGQMLIAEGRRNVIFFPDRSPWSVEGEGLKRAYREAGIPLNENLFLKDFHNVHEKISEILSYGIPVDALYGQFLPQSEIENYLLESYPDLYKQCTLVSGALTVPAESPFHRLEYVFPFEEFGEKSASLIRHALSGDSEVKHYHLDVPIKSV